MSSERRSLDPGSQAALETILAGENPGQSGLYLVTVHGGRIVGYQIVSKRIDSSSLLQQRSRRYGSSLGEARPRTSSSRRRS